MLTKYNKLTPMPAVPTDRNNSQLNDVAQTENSPAHDICSSKMLYFLDCTRHKNDKLRVSLAVTIRGWGGGICQSLKQGNTKKKGKGRRGGRELMIC